jgi:hypothetical protein
MKPTMSRSNYWIGLIVLGMTIIPAPAGRMLADDEKTPEFAFTTPKPDTKVAANDPITVSGVHRLGTDEHVWVFLLDSFGGYYLQNPAVEILKNGKWEATNIRPRKGIRAIVAVRVDKKGDERIREWVEVKRWGKISANEVKELCGYKELDRVPIVTPKPE